MNILLAQETHMSIGDAAIFALFGFVLVIIVLFVLVFILMLVAKFTNANIVLPWKKSATTNNADLSGISGAIPAGSDAETAAAISAAIAVILTEQKKTAPTAGDAEDNVPLPFIIKSIRKI